MSSHGQAAKALGYERIGKLLFQYSMPAIIAMTVSSLYNIIDRIFIGHGVGPLAISGLALTLPIMNLAIAFGALVGAGAATLVSIRLGEKREDEASRILGTTVLLNIILSTVVSVVMLVFLENILYMFGASDKTLPYAKQFMQVILAGNVMLHSYMGLNNIMRASGYPHKAMITTLLTVAVNIALAPLFIFVFNWGIRGAAFATLAAQLTGLVITVSHFMSRKSYVRFLRGHFVFDLRIIKSVLLIGAPSFFINICACFIAIMMNLKLVKYGGDYAVGAFGIINSMLMCIVMIVIGLNQGMQPIAGYNYGARHFRRVTKVFKYTIIIATCITTTGFLFGELFPHRIAAAFTGNKQLIDLSTYGMRLAMLMYPMVGFQMVTSNFFQSIGRAKLSICLTISRQIGFLIPALLILPGIFGLTGVWVSLPVSDFSASLLAFVMLKREVKRIKGLDPETVRVKAQVISEN